MKLTSDYKGRITSSELFPPLTVFNAERQPDGSVRVVELVEKEVPPNTLVRSPEGYLMLEKPVDRATILAAIRADRDRQ